MILFDVTLWMINIYREILLFRYPVSQTKWLYGVLVQSDGDILYIFIYTKLKAVIQHLKENIWDWMEERRNKIYYCTYNNNNSSTPRHSSSTTRAQTRTASAWGLRTTRAPTTRAETNGLTLMEWPMAGTLSWCLMLSSTTTPTLPILSRATRYTTVLSLHHFHRYWVF